ncbi:MAG: JDVT-CTERM system glutamic-type intramembrane protease [Gammaproteobacteria bacterium]
MANDSVPDILRYLANEAGFRPARRCWHDYRLALALVAGVLVVWAGHSWLPPFSSHHAFDWKLMASLIIWQPLFEEILFRGLIQGQLLKRDWGQRSRLQISTANIITSLLFVGIHLFMNSPLFSMTLLIPSLVYGYFRDRCNSVYPSILLHSAYNAFVIIGLVIAG